MLQGVTRRNLAFVLVGLPTWALVDVTWAMVSADHSLTHSLTHSISHSFTLTVVCRDRDALSHSLTHPLAHSLIHCMCAALSASGPSARGIQHLRVPHPLPHSRQLDPTALQLPTEDQQHLQYTQDHWLYSRRGDLLRGKSRGRGRVE